MFKGTHPAWNDENLREVATHIRTPLLFAHVRASSGTPVQRSNCHPFRYGRWLWMHNGSLAGFPEVKRDLLMAVDPSLYPHIEGSTDTETLFFLAFTFGLTDDPPTAVARAVGLVEDVGRRHGVEYPVHMTVATTDGEAIWIFRYSSEKATSSLYYSTDSAQVRKLYPELDGPRSPGCRRPLHRLRATAGPSRSVERGPGGFVGARPAGASTRSSRSSRWSPRELGNRQRALSPAARTRGGRSE